MYSTTLPFAITLPADVPFAFRLQTLRDRLQTLVDHRDRRGVRYPLAAMFTIAVLAKLAGASRVEALADWARLRASDVARLFGLARLTMPHARTWGRIFAQAVDPCALEQVLCDSFHEVQHTAEVPARGSLILAVDGKPLRGTIPAGQTKGVHMVAAYLPEQGIVLAQLAVAEKPNEIVALPELIAQLDVTGMVVTGDAMQAQRALSIQIVEAGGDYLWMVKENPPSLYADLVLVCGPEVIGGGCRALPLDFRTARSIDNAHGRVEERGITVRSLLNDYTPWPDLEQVFKLERFVTTQRGKTTREVRYGGTSLPATVTPAERLLHIARAEWGIENGLHDRRDVTLDEDRSRMRRGTVPHVLAA